MKLRLGCELSYRLKQPTPMIAMLNAHHAHAPFFDVPDRLMTTPAVPLSHYRDGFGNWCTRLVAPAGVFVLGTDGTICDHGAPDPIQLDAIEHRVETLPPETLTYLLGSRYCETDRLMECAWDNFGSLPPGWARVQSICDFVNRHVAFGYEHSDPTQTASETLARRRGVCRDFAHLAITMCRCLNIPARYCTGYVSDIGQSPPFAAMDFAAWMEVYLSGAWRIFDPRNNTPRVGRILIAQGRDAVDVPLTHSFGEAELASFRVWIDPVDGPGTPVAD